MEIKNRYEKLGSITALASFAVGTIMLLVYFLTMSEIVALESYFVVLLVLIFNIIVLGILVFKLSKNGDKSKILKTIGLMFLNLPVAIIYFYIFNFLINTVRVTIKNETNFTIQNILIKGCEEKNIEKLDKNESNMIWIRIPHDCSISVAYKINDQNREKEILGYVTNLGGSKVEYKITDEF